MELPDEEKKVFEEVYKLYRSMKEKGELPGYTSQGPAAGTTTEPGQ